MKTVLLVDDEKWVRSALRWTLGKTALDIMVKHECENGLDALDWLKTNQVDLVITDVRMPIMDGLNLVKEIRSRNERQDIIIISVHDDFRFVQEALRQGVMDYLLKPIELEALKECLEKWLIRSRQAVPDTVVPVQDAAVKLTPVEQVVKYIETTPPGEITLAEAAKRVHMNPSYLSQLFKQQKQMCFVDYVTEIRIKEAKRLLTTTSLRISEIADRLGYSDLAYFSTIFKRVTANTPSEFRQKEQCRA